MLDSMRHCKLDRADCMFFVEALASESSYSTCYLTSRLQKSCQAPSCCCKPVAAMDVMDRLSANKLATPTQCLNSGLSSKQALVFRTLVCQLRSLKQIGTSDPNSGVATCQPGNVSLVRNLQHVPFLAVNTNKLDKLQALAGVSSSACSC